MIDALHGTDPWWYVAMVIGFDVLLKATLLLIGAIALDRVFASRGRVLLRSALWNAVLLALVLLPVSTVALPRLSIRCLPPLPVSENPAPKPIHATTPPPEILHDATDESELMATVESNADAALMHAALERTSDSTGRDSVSADPTGSLAVVPDLKSQISNPESQISDFEPGKTTAGTRSEVTPSGAIPAWFAVLLGAYVLGFVLCLIRLAGSLIAVRRLRLSGRPVPGAIWIAAMARCRSVLDIREDVTLACSSKINVPITFGWRRPVILLPAALESMTPQQAEAILLHELAHIRRSDYAWQLLLRIVQAVYWPHPLIWRVGRFLSTVREQACDDLCAFHSQTPATYRAALLHVASRLVRRPAVSLGIAMARSTNVADRLGRIDRGHRSAQCLARRPLRLAIVCLALLTVSVIGAAQLARSEPVKPEPTPPPAATQPSAAVEITTSQPASIDLHLSERTSPEAWRQIAKVLSARQLIAPQFQNLHIVASCQQEKLNKQTGQWETTRARKETRSWYESLLQGRVRIDFDPDITEWIGGAAPYAENRYTITYDGSIFTKIDHVYGHDPAGYTSRVTDRRSERTSELIEGESWGTGIDVLPGADPQRIFNSLLEAPQAPWVKMEAETIEENGRSLTRIRIDQPSAASRYEWVFDPGRGYAFVRYQLSNDKPTANKPAVICRLEASDWKQLPTKTPYAGGLWFPTVWQRDIRETERWIFRARVVDFYFPDDARAIFSAKDIVLERPSPTPPSGFVPGGREISSSQAAARTSSSPPLSSAPAMASETNDEEEPAFPTLVTRPPALDVDRAHPVAPETLQVSVEARFAVISAERERRLHEKYPALKAPAQQSFGVIESEQLDELLTDLPTQEAPRLIIFDDRPASIRVPRDPARIKLPALDDPNGKPGGASGSMFVDYELPLGCRLGFRPNVSKDRQYVTLQTTVSYVSLIADRNQNIEEEASVHGALVLPDKTIAFLRSPIRAERISGLRLVKDEKDPRSSHWEMVRESLGEPEEKKLLYVLLKPTIIIPNKAVRVQSAAQPGPVLPSIRAAAAPPGTSRPASAVRADTQPQTALTPRPFTKTGYQPLLQPLPAKQIATQPALGIPPAATTNVLEFRVVQARTKQPLPGVRLSVTFDRKQGPETATDSDGQAALPMPEPWPDSAAVLATQASFVPTRVTWTKWRESPGVPHAYTLALEPGTTIGGTVKDVNDGPIQGVSVHLTLRGADCGDAISCADGNYAAISNVTVKTDAAGHWRYDQFPPGRAEPLLMLRHPDYIEDEHSSYRPAPPLEKLRDQSSVMVMHKGMSVAGRVTDQDGKPIDGATIVQGELTGPDSPRRETDPDGRFTFSNVPPGATVLTVTAPGHAPDVRQFDAKPGAAAVDFRLGPAHTLRARVVDPEGKTVPKAYVQTNSWRGVRSLRWEARTDDEGRVQWNEAPADEVQFSVAAASGETYWYENQQPRLTASSQESLITLKRRMRTPDETAAKSALNRKGESKSDSMRGTVVLPDGTQAAGASIGAAGDGCEIMINGGQIHFASSSDAMGSAERAKTDATGGFTLPKLKKPFLIVAMHDGGYAEALDKDFARSPRIQLKPWGRIEGVARVGRRLVKSETVDFVHSWWTPDTSLRMAFTGRPQSPRVTYTLTTSTDDQGRFILDRVPPGEAVVNRRQRLGSSTFTSTGHVRASVEPGKTSIVPIGGVGRPVTGRFVAPKGTIGPIGWPRSLFSHASARIAAQPLFATQEQRRTARETYDKAPSFTFTPDNEGRSTIDDVPAGTYTLSGTLMSRPYNINSPPGKAIGELTYQFTIPEITAGGSDEPLDLGDLQMKPQ